MKGYWTGCLEAVGILIAGCLIALGLKVLPDIITTVILVIVLIAVLGFFLWKAKEFDGARGEK